MHVRIARRGLTWVLGLLAAGALRRYRPVVVAVTGSSGKTTTKDLTAAVLATRFDVRATPATANNEVAAPGVVLGGPRGPSALARLQTVLAGLSLLLRRRPYPDVLVLELAAGRPGELQRLTRRIRPDVAIVTNVRPVHRVHYDDFAAIVQEKSWPVRRLTPTGTAVLNRDDPAFAELAALAPGRVITYGAAGEIRLEDVVLAENGATARVLVAGMGEFRLSSRLLGAHQLSGVLAAVGAGLALGVPPAEALAAVTEVEAAPGRLRAHRDACGVVVLDDTYNATPQAVVDALHVLARFPRPRTAVLGTMIMLGPETEAGHRTVGAAAAACADALVVVGEHGHLIADAAVASGMAPDSAVETATAEEAARVVGASAGSGTTLVKGSATLGLEVVVTALVPGAEVVTR